MTTILLVLNGAGSFRCGHLRWTDRERHLLRLLLAVDNAAVGAYRPIILQGWLRLLVKVVLSDLHICIALVNRKYMLLETVAATFHDFSRLLILQRGIQVDFETATAQPWSILIITQLSGRCGSFPTLLILTVLLCRFAHNRLQCLFPLVEWCVGSTDTFLRQLHALFI